MSHLYTRFIEILEFSKCDKNVICLMSVGSTCTCKKHLFGHIDANGTVACTYSMISRVPVLVDTNIAKKVVKTIMEE